MDTSILDFGAVSGGKMLCTEAFRHAVEACASSGGGYVDIPSGSYLTGTVALDDNVFLRLHPGTEILGSERLSDYSGVSRGCAWSNTITSVSGNGAPDMDRCRGLIVADRKKNCGIVGPGKINGQRGADYGYSDEKGRPFLVVFSECSFVTVRDVRLEHTGMFTFYGLNCSDVVIDGVVIRTADSANGDGLDFDGGRRISISNCDIDAGDDAIGLKTLTPDEPIVDFSVTNCHLRSHYWGGVRIGPESAGDMKRITVTGCTFTDCGDGFKLQLTQEAVYEDFVFTGNVMHNVLRPLFVTMNRYNMSRYVTAVRPPMGAFRRVIFSDTVAEMSPDFVFPGLTIHAGNFISSVPGYAIEDFTIENVHFLAPGGGTEAEAVRTTGHSELYDFYTLWPEHLVNMGNYPSAVLYLRHAKDIRISNVTFEAKKPDARPAVRAEDVEGLDLTFCREKNCGGLILKHRVTDYLSVGNRGCESDFSEEQAKDYEAFRSLSLAVDAEYERIASDAGKAAALPLLEKKKELAFSLPTGRPVTVLLPNVTGNFEIRVGGKTVFVRSLPALYITPLPFAMTVDAPKDGESLFEIVPLSESFSLNADAQIKKGVI